MRLLIFYIKSNVSKIFYINLLNIMEPKVDPPVFKITKWNVIGCWASDGNQGNCAICKN